MINRFRSAFWTVEKLQELLLGIEQARITGTVVHIRTGPNMETDFDPKSVDLDKLHDEILFALNALDPDLNPLVTRSGVTLSVFQ